MHMINIAFPGADDKLMPVDVEVVKRMMEQHTDPDPQFCTPQFYDIAERILINDNLALPTNLREAEQLYLHMVTVITEDAGAQ